MDSFIQIRHLIQNTELLHHPDFNEPFYIFCDSSQYYYSGILLQKRHDKYVTIDMFSKSWNKINRKKHITTKELLALVDCFKLWQQYLYTNQTYIHSDSRNLAFLFKKIEAKRSNNQMHYKWVTLLSEFNFEVRFIPGIYNKVADYLSRYIDPEQLRNNFQPGSVSMIEYNKHKRFRFDYKKKRQKYKDNRFIYDYRKKKQKLMFLYTKPEQYMKPEDDYHRKVYYANLYGTKYWHKDYMNSWYQAKLSEPLPEEITCNSTFTQYMMIANKHKIMVRRSKRLREHEKLIMPKTH